MNPQGRLLPQEEQAERMIEVGVGQQHGTDRRVADGRGARAQRSESLDLLTQIRRCIDQKPLLPIGTNRDARLGSCRDPSLACGQAIGARTIPLRQPTAGRRAKQTNANCSLLPDVRSERTRVAGALKENHDVFDARFDPALLGSGYFHGEENPESVIVVAGIQVV